MTKRDFQMKSDGLGIALFAFGVFSAVLVFQAMRSEIGPDPTTLQWVAGFWLASVGALPSLVFNAVLAVLGARLFLGTSPFGLRKHVIAAAFTSAALAILCGAFSDSAGGVFGARLGGTLSSFAGVVVGAGVGALAVIASVWFFWLRRDVLPAEEPMNVRNPELATEAELRDDGVTNAEAEALLPRPLSEVRPIEQVIPPSPYPEDVRRRGEIPAGTRPIATTASAAAPAAPSVYRWTAPAGVKPIPQAAPAIAADDPEFVTPAPLAVQALPAAEPIALPRASWEGEEQQVELDEAPTAAAEPVDDIAVDAYGTPLTLVEALRRGEPAAEPDELEEFVEELSAPRPLVRASALAPEIDDPRLDEAQDELADDEPATVSDAPRTTVAAELDEPEEQDETEEEVELDEDGLPAEQDDEAEFDDEPLEFEAETDPEFESPTRAPIGVAWENDEEPANELAAPAADEAVVANAAAPTDGAPTDGALVSAAELAQADELAEQEFERRTSAVDVEAKRSPARTRGQEVLDFDSAGAPVPAVPVSSVFVPAEEGVERNVVLTPPPVAAERAIKTPAATGSGESDAGRSALLAEVGCLFIDRGRVAVSMLQRQYSMDFDDACKVLDDLQNMGLIGPYLGGQRRDILLTREQWLEKVGAS